MTPAPHAIEGVTALLGDELRPVVPATVVIHDGLVGAAGQSQEVAVPPGATRLDHRGLALLPGFIDAHVHMGFVRPRDVLAGGVTTVRDLGWPPERIFALARRSRARDFDGPAIVAAGPMLTVGGGYPMRASWAPSGTGLDVGAAGGPERAVALVAELGAAVVKVALDAGAGPTLEAATLRTIVEVAHGRGLRVTGHVSGLAELHKALDAGVDELAHMPMGVAIPDETLARMVAAGTTIVPTLAIFSGRGLRRAVAGLERFLAQGGRVVYGTDLGNSGPRPGIDPREVRALGRAGMSALDVIRVATVASARILGLDAGVIAPGAPADLVAVPESALGSSKDLTRVAQAWRRGRPVR